jgi:hypothetical protein
VLTVLQAVVERSKTREARISFGEEFIDLGTVIGMACGIDEGMLLLKNLMTMKFRKP